MKKLLLSVLALMLGFAVLAQQPHLKSSTISMKRSTDQKIAIEPVQGNAGAPSVIHRGNGDSPSIVSPIVLGTSANANGYGYGGGQKTLVWADDTLKAVMNIHRMGPGTTPPSFSGYLAADWAPNMGVNAADWHINYQIYAAVLNTGGTYYLDAGRYPQGGIYSPPGNTSLDNAYIVYFAPNLSNSLSSWGGYSYGRSTFTDQADTTKHMYWYDAPPYTYIPDGFTIMQNGTALVSDIDQNWESGSLEYAGNLLVHRGVWNNTTHDYDYTMNITVPLPTTDNNRPSNVRIAASPDNAHVWMVALGDNGGTTPVSTNAYDYPILYHSLDGGLTWSDPIAVQLDGPNGILAIVNGLYSDYWISQNFDPIPSREEIQYTTAFDCDLVVDKWGNPHIGVVVGLGGSDPYSIATGIDSIMAVYDIYSPDEGQTWCGVKMGTPKTFRGTFGTDFTEDNRTNISITESGEKLVVTWLDTDVSGVTDNQNPDVFARGFDLLTNKITVNADGAEAPDNVTFLSDLMTQAYFGTASHYLFTDGDNVRVPICTELLSDPTNSGAPVTFYYIPDFIYTPAQFTVTPAIECPVDFPVGVKAKDLNISMNINPNPVKDVAKVSVNASKAGNAGITVTNAMGQNVMTFSKNLTSGENNFEFSVSNLNNGIYFVTITVNDQKFTKKMIVE